MELLDSLFAHPGVDVVGVEANELADLVKRNAAFLDQAANEAFGHTEVNSEPADVQQEATTLPVQGRVRFSG